jgi:ATP dependent DNA ligase domain
MAKYPCGGLTTRTFAVAASGVRNLALSSARTESDFGTQVWPISTVRASRFFGASVLIFAALLLSSQLALAQFTQQGPKLVGTVRAKSFTLDGEAVVAGADGVAVFDALHRRGRVTDAILQAFDLLELDGEDLRPLPLGKRKGRLARLLARVQVGIAINEHTDENGAVVFMRACKMGLEGIVSKRLTAPYRSGPSRDWLKVKNPNSPAMIRAREHFARLGQ